MGKMNEFSQAIDELHRCGDALIGVADSLRDLISDNDTEAEDKQTVEVTAPLLTLEAVRAVLAGKSRAGFTAQIRSLLQKYGADKLSGIDPANYEALLSDVDGLTDAT